MSQAQRHARPLNRSESQVRTRAALLDAAEALIVEHSIPALSLRAVCTRAGYTQGAFYSNFADREELLLEVMERNLEQKAASLEQMLATCGDAGSRRHPGVHPGLAGHHPPSGRMGAHRHGAGV
ncbi:TetR/AcrR family transcriptional regulator [Pseudomonas aeruginosa]